uniref:Uncharacterized protein n=1 Tax=viral metagenome TaxID=1070528 RepID=A0A6C0KY38_9ZZZZ
MDNFKDLFKRERKGEILLTILFIIYILMGYKIPESLASVIDTAFGKIIVITIAILLFSYTNPVLGVIGFYVAFDLIKRSSESTGTYALQRYVPTETKKACELTLYNQFPYTLEQEIVKKMAPINKTDDSNTPPSFSPILDNLHEAAPINYTGVV